jgi:hypothetical protein
LKPSHSVLADLYSDNKVMFTNVINAIISHTVAQCTPGITSVGANKDYLNNSAKAMAVFQAFRGYFTSIRPGTLTTLLNVNTSTTAFLPPMKVSDFIRSYTRMDGERAAEKMLVGKEVRITYDRKQHDKDGQIPSCQRKDQGDQVASGDRTSPKVLRSNE